MISYLQIAKKALMDDDVAGQAPPKSEFVPIWFSDAPKLLAWACRVSEADITLAQPIEYSEARLCKVLTKQVSEHAARHLRTITSARIQRETGGWGLWSPEWWQKREDEAFEALARLRQAMIERGDLKV